MENKKKTNKEKIKDIYVGSITIPPQNGVSNGYAGDKPIYTLQGDAANRYFKALIQEREREVVKDFADWIFEVLIPLDAKDEWLNDYFYKEQKEQQ